MTKNEWQLHYGFSDEDMQDITDLVEVTNGKITAVFDEPLKYKLIKLDKVNNNCIITV